MKERKRENGIPDLQRVAVIRDGLVVSSEIYFNTRRRR